MKKSILLIVLLIVASSFTTSKRVEKLIQKEVKAVFKIESFTKNTIEISEEILKTLPLKINANNFFEIINKENKLGYYYLGKAYGKADYFDFIVIFDKELIVSKVKILVYREDHGGEIGSRRWLKQFIGKTFSNKLKYQKDIAAISGSTISAKAMTNEVNKLLKTISILNEKTNIVTMQVHGLIHQFPKEIKTLIIVFIIVLSVGFYGGLSFVNNTTSMQPSGVETHYLGNENDEEADIMKFKKSKREILTIVHNHILSLSIIFFFLSLILSTTSINKKLKYFLMIEPLMSVLLTFGGIYFLWSGYLWVKYIIIFSGILMTISFVLATITILYQLLFSKS